jgi:DNA-damage-inducible protein J
MTARRSVIWLTGRRFKEVLCFALNKPKDAIQCISEDFGIMATTMVHIRVDEKVKRKASKALAAMGMSLSDAVRMLLIRVAAEQALPFEVKAPNPTAVSEVMASSDFVGKRAKIPNRTTVKALQELDRGGGKRFNSADDLFRDLGI